MSSLPITAGSATTRPRVIVIDDDPLFRNLLVSVLRKDFFVSVASEGSEGYYKAIEHPPDVAVIDVQMPGWDGLKTLKAFRAHQQLSHVLAVMLTGDASRETVMAAIQGGAHDYIIKTKFSREEFLAKLGRLLASRDASPDAPEEPKPAPDAPIPAAPPSPAQRPDLPPPPPPTCSAPADDPVPTPKPDLQAVLDAWE